MITWLPVLLPVIGAVAVLAVANRRSWLGPVALAGLGAGLVASVGAVLVGGSAKWGWGATLSLTLQPEGAGRVMAVLVPTVAVPVVAFAASSLRHDPGLAKLLTLLLGFVAAMELLVLAGDFLTLLVGWELVGAASWALIGHDWRQPDAPVSAKEAFVTTRLGDLGLYVAAGAAVAGSGSLAFADLSAASSGWLAVVAGGVVLAAAAKSAQVPFSPWLFSAMAGPTPVSALLHSATMVAAGAYLLIRLQPVLSPVPWFGPLVVGLGLTTALAGGLVALAQTDLKRALAGSTSAQYGLMLVATGAGYTAAGLGQLTAHAFFKALLFLGAGVALHAAGTLDLGRLRLGSKLPRVAAIYGVGTAALAAVPPLGGAFTKETVLAAAFEAGTWTGAGVIVAGALSAAYASRLHLLAYGPGPSATLREAPSRMEVRALALLALASLGLGLLWLPGGSRILEVLADGAAPEGKAWELAVSVGGLIVAFGVVWALWRRDRLVGAGMWEPMRRFIGGWWGLPFLARRIVVDPILGFADWASGSDRSLVDGLVSGVAGAGLACSEWLRRRAERLVDWLVEGVGGSTLRSAALSRRFDDDGVDAAVEGLAVSIGWAGDQSTKTQTGMTHHYYALLAAGAVLAILVAALWR